jgi:succinate-acetate transporter protein
MFVLSGFGQLSLAHAKLLRFRAARALATLFLNDHQTVRSTSGTSILFYILYVIFYNLYSSVSCESYDNLILEGNYHGIVLNYCTLFYVLSWGGGDVLSQRQGSLLPL